MPFDVPAVVEAITIALNQDIAEKSGPIIQQNIDSVNAMTDLTQEQKDKINNDLSNSITEMNPENMILTKLTVEKIFQEIQNKLPEEFAVKDNPDYVPEGALPRYILYRLT